MTPTEIALIVASVIPSIIMLWLTRGIQKSDEMQKAIDSVDKRLIAVESGMVARAETMRRIEIHIEKLESKIDLLISKLMERGSGL